MSGTREAELSRQNCILKRKLDEAEETVRYLQAELKASQVTVVSPDTCQVVTPQQKSRKRARTEQEDQEIRQLLDVSRGQALCSHSHKVVIHLCCIAGGVRIRLI